MSLVVCYRTPSFMMSAFHLFGIYECMFVYHRSALASAHQGQPLPKTLSVMESTPQVRGMHTIIRSEHIFTSNTFLKWMKTEIGGKKLAFKGGSLANVAGLKRYSISWLLLLSMGQALTTLSEAVFFILFSPALPACLCRNKETNRDEFIFYSKRLMRLLIEHALSFLPLKVSFCVIWKSEDFQLTSCIQSMWRLNLVEVNSVVTNSNLK